MATVIRNVHKTGKITFKVKARRKGFPTRTRTFDTKPEALAWGARTEAEMDRGEHSTNRNAEHTTLGDVLARYRDEVSSTHRGAKIEMDKINVFLRHPVNKLPMSKVTPAAMAAWRDERLRKAGAGTVLRELTIVRAAIKIARNDWGIDLKECPISRISKPKAPEPRDRRLQDGEEARLLAGCAGCRCPSMRPAILFALETAMRQGEIVSLEWAQVDLVKRTARLLMTKNGSQRVVPLSTKAVEVLMGMPRDTRFVFQAFQSYSIKYGFYRIVRRIGLDDFTFHTLRHEAISRLVEKGLNLLEVAAISGHKTMDMLKRYTHLRAEDLALKLG